LTELQVIVGVPPVGRGGTEFRPNSSATAARKFLSCRFALLNAINASTLVELRQREEDGGEVAEGFVHRSGLGNVARPSQPGLRPSRIA
jgi:hypothetical protein